MMARWLPAVRQRATTVTVLTQSSLIPLLRDQWEGVECVDSVAGLSDIAAWVWGYSLPLVLGEWPRA
jgi:hypothetical protein